MIDATHRAVGFDAAWAINSRRDLVRAMITRAMAEEQGTDE
jgi:hypothetical protein